MICDDLAKVSPQDYSFCDISCQITPARAILCHTVLRQSKPKQKRAPESGRPVKYCGFGSAVVVPEYLSETICNLLARRVPRGYLPENGVLSRFTYHNVVAAGLQTLEFEWVEDFIVRYKNALERTYRDSSYSFNLARLEFKRKRYGDALQLLQHTNYYDPLLSLAARTMSLKIYYELNEYDLLDSHLEALKNYIRRKTALGYHRSNYLNLVRYIQKMISINRSNKTEVESLKQKILAEPVLTEREWLLEQLAAFRH